MEELKGWHKKSGLPLNKFFNTSGLLYKELKLKDKLPSMSEEEKYNLLASDGMLVKRPILIVTILFWWALKRLTGKPRAVSNSRPMR